MQQDMALREAARAIYESVYPSSDWTPVPFDEAERYGTTTTAMPSMRPAGQTRASMAMARTNLC